LLLVPLLVLAASCKGFGADPVEPDAGAEMPEASTLPPCPNGALSFGGKSFVKVDGPDASVVMPTCPTGARP
jgi:hypothetical protein